jgi:hypothetical protein
MKTVSHSFFPRLRQESLIDEHVTIFVIFIDIISPTLCGLMNPNTGKAPS